MKIVGVIPAHLASVRFPQKILFDIHGLPMIEHVRRRALLCGELEDVIVAIVLSLLSIGLKKKIK